MRDRAPARVAGAERHDRHDVRGPDARMDAVVRAQVDPSARLADPGDEPVLERLVVADQREHRTVVVAVDMRVEHTRARARERVRDRSDDRRVATLGDVRHGLEQGARRATLRPMREPTAPAYYDRRAPEYDDWYLGAGSTRTATATGSTRSSHASSATLAALPPPGRSTSHAEPAS